MLQLCSVYYVGALSVHALIPRIAGEAAVTPVNPKLGKRTKSQQRQMAREAFVSLGPIAVKAAVFCVCEAIHERKYGLLYDGALCRSSSLPVQMAVIAATVLSLDVLHDTWFYFTHLLMHKNRWLLSNVHYLHHQSKVPTPFSGYSLHVLEALIVFFDEILCVFVIPMHVSIHRLYHLYTTLIHIGGHASYELHPLVPSLEQLAWILFKGGEVSREINTVLYHNLHHQFPGCNFSLYFGHWDTFFKTNYGSYFVEIMKVKDKGKDNCTGRYYLILMSSMLVMVVASALTFVLLYNTRLYITNLLRL